MKRCALILLLSLVGSFTRAEEPALLKLVPVDPLPPRILVGDGFVYQLVNPEGEVLTDLQADPIDGKDPAKEGFRVIPEGKGLRIHPVRAGALAFPALLWKKNSGEIVGKTEAIGLQVESLMGAKQEPPPELLPPVGFPFPLWVGIVGGILALAILVLGVFLFFRWLRARGAKAMTPFSAIRAARKSEAEEALEALARLDGEGLANRGEFRLHAFRLTEILKRYLGRRFDFDAPECTTEEIRARAEAFPLGPELRQKLSDLLARLDRVKFAGEIPPQQVARDDLRAVRAFVEGTRRQPERENLAVS